jgi:hypothetical protein
MSFPTSPTNGQQASINGITYTYSSALTAWTVSTSVSNSFVSISVAGNVNSGNLLATGTASVTGNVQGANVNGTTVSATGNVVGGNVTTTGLTKTATFSVTGNVIGNLLPSANITYDLGSSTQRWRDLWLSGTTIQLGAASISASGDSVSLGAGNISGNYVFGNGSQLTGIAVFVTAVAYPGIATAADPAGSQTITVTGTGFNSGITAYINSTSCATTYGNSTSLTFVTPVTSVGTYNVSLYNTDGTNGTKPGGIVFSPIPVWVTASGALTGATLDAPYSTSVSATGDGITYSVTTGSLPTGLSLNASTGAITGTPTVAATSTFSITATDAQNQGVARSFSIAVISVIAVDYLVVAGGGGAGLNYSGGGGGGGLLTNSVTVAPGVTYSITVGGGGATSATGSNSSISGSGFTTVTSIGGGYGGAYPSPDNGANGGSGGGGGSSFTAGIGGKGVYPGSAYLSQARQGYDGGDALSAGGYSTGGGGGAGAAGQPPAGLQASKGGDGGIGLTSSITGTSTYYAGGGGGYGYNSDKGIGGLGGGGNGGGNPIPVASTAGATNTGGGGGGGTTDGSGGGGKAGGSGVIILRFLSTVTPTGTTGSPTITTDGSYSVYKFTASGSITF